MCVGRAGARNVRMGAARWSPRERWRAQEWDSRLRIQSLLGRRPFWAETALFCERVRYGGVAVNTCCCSCFPARTNYSLILVLPINSTSACIGIVKEIAD